MAAAHFPQGLLVSLCGIHPDRTFQGVANADATTNAYLRELDAAGGGQDSSVRAFRFLLCVGVVIYGLLG